MKKNEVNEGEKVLLRKTLVALKDVPTKQEAAARVRDAVKKVTDNGAGGSFWNYFAKGERTNAISLSWAFERAAR